MHILTINAGSSSLKYKIFHFSEQTQLLLSGLIEGIGESNGDCHSHSEAFDFLTIEIKKNLPDITVDGIGHRVVHGGNLFSEPTLINKEILKTIQELSFLAPLHNPLNALGIESALSHFPQAVQVAVFDSGFHQTMPEHVKRYAIDYDTANHYQIRRYGFHGINHEYVAHQAALFLNKPLSACNLISLHLGNGASACLIKKGKSFDTSMGMTPLAGLVMGTRCGDIDPAIPFYLQEQGLSPTETETLLNRHSGLKGLTGDNDMRNILARYEANDERATLAIEIYVYAIQKILGAYFSQTNRIDAVIFTGGVGENAALIREKVMASLNHFKLFINLDKNNQRDSSTCRSVSSEGVPILVIKSDEEIWIASKVKEMFM